MTVLVQAGVIGSSPTSARTGPAQPAPVWGASAPAARSVLPAAETPSPHRALVDLNRLLAESAGTKADLGKSFIPASEWRQPTKAESSPIPSNETTKPPLAIF
jgi:hypothetical protein